MKNIMTVSKSGLKKTVSSLFELKEILNKEELLLLEDVPKFSQDEADEIISNAQIYRRAAFWNPNFENRAFLKAKTKIDERRMGAVQTISFSVNYLTHRQSDVVFDVAAISTFAGGKIVRSDVSFFKQPIRHGFITLEFDNGVLARYCYTNADSVAAKDLRIYSAFAETNVFPLKEKVVILDVGLFNKPRNCKVSALSVNDIKVKAKSDYFGKKVGNASIFLNLTDYAAILQITENFN